MKKYYSLRSLITFVVVFGVVGTYIIFRSFAATPVIASILADQMTLPAGASIVLDSNASTGKAVELTAGDSSLNGTVNLPSAVTSLSVVARAPVCGNGKFQTLLAVRIDNNLVNSDYSVGTSYSSYSANVSEKPGSHTLNIKMANPNTACAHTMYVDVTDFYGPQVQNPPPTVSVSATPASVNQAQASTITWTSTNATSCNVTGAWTGSVATSGSESTGALNATSTYDLSCSGPGGSASQNVTVTVTPANQGGGNGNGKMLGLNNNNYDETENGTPNYYLADQQKLGANWDRVQIWGDNAISEYTVCGSGDPYFLPLTSIDSAACGAPHVAATLAKYNINLFPLISPVDGDTSSEAFSYVKQGSCSASNDYTTCLSDCSNPALVAGLTCTGQLSWVQNAVHVATVYAKGGSFWNGNPNEGSPVIEVGNEVYIQGNVTNNQGCGPPYNWPDDECQNPQAYADMLMLAAKAVQAATNGNVKLVAESFNTYTTPPDPPNYPNGQYESWNAAMQTEQPGLTSILGGIAVHPYGNIPTDNICIDGTTCTDNNSDWNYPDNLTGPHMAWPQMPVYITEAAANGVSYTLDNPAGQYGFTEQCAALNQYLTDFRNNSWEAGFFWYGDVDFGAFNGSSQSGQSLIDDSSDTFAPGEGTNTNFHKPVWYDYQSQIENGTASSCSN